MGKNSSPIGIFDSGAGGITVLKPACRAFPREDFIYLGDSASAPYGTKGVGEIISLSRLAAGRLVSMGIKMLVIACNTASSAAARDLRQWLDIPVIAMEPALKPAFSDCGGGRIIVMATHATLSLPRFAQSMAIYGANAVAAPVYGVVELIEAGITHGVEIERHLGDALLHHLSPDTEAIVLGCTHYSFVRDSIARLAGNRVQIIDGSGGTVRQIGRVLLANGLKTNSSELGKVTILSSGGKASQQTLDKLFREYNG